MSKTNKIILVFFLLLLVLLVYFESNQKEPVNWNPSYSEMDKIPLGTFVLYESLLEKHFEIQTVKQPPYEHLKRANSGGIYFFVNNHLVFDDAELEELLDWTSRGNTLFLAADAFSKNLLDTLNLNTTTAMPEDGISSKPMLNLTNLEFRSKNAFLFDHETYHSVFIKLDTLKHTVLGISQLYSDTLQITKPRINYLKIPFGEGTIFLNTTPQAFSNFFILDHQNAKYVENALSYLPAEKTLFWDSYYKAGKAFHSSPLYILMNNKALKWAYYFAIFGALLFVLFEGKRKQRSIPVITPPENKTYQFTRTIAGLFLDRKDYKGIAAKKINLFLDHIRNQYRIPTDDRNEKFYADLAAQSGNTPKDIKSLFTQIDHLEQKNILTKEELLNLNRSINSFKNKNNGK